jgi:hypothetical protein
MCENIMLKFKALSMPMGSHLGNFKFFFFQIQDYRKYIGKSKSIIYLLCLNYVQIKTTHIINSQNIDNSEYFGVKFVKIYPRVDPII